MKRIISALLVIVMLAAMITVPTVTVSAEGWAAPTAGNPVTMTNTTQMINTDAKHLYATKGTPTIDGTMDAVWENAFTLRYDMSQKLLSSTANYSNTILASFYIMWDNSNLYILEVRDYAKPVHDSTITKNYDIGTADCSLFYIVLPNEVDEENASGKYGAVNMPHIAPGDTSIIGTTVEGELVTKVESNVFGRLRPYKTTTLTDAGNSTNSFWTYTDSDDGKALKAKYATEITSYTTLTENGFMMETAISWDLLDDYNTEAYVPAVGDLLGINPNVNDGNGNGSELANLGDHTNFMALELVETNKTVRPAIPDMSWFNNPECLSEDGYYEISDADDLLGLAFLSIGHSTHTDFSSLGVNSIGAGTVTQNKKYRIMNNITFNEGWDVDSGVAPTLNAWPVINQFQNAEIDGNGKTVSGLYQAVGVNYSDRKDGIGFIGRMSQNVYIHDLNLTNGKFVGDTNASTPDNVGSFAGLVNSNSTGGRSIIQNCSSDLILETTALVDGKNNYVGGICGGHYTGGSNYHYILIDDCTFSGTIISKGKGSGGIIGQGNSFKTYYTGKDNDYSAATGVTSDNLSVFAEDPTAYIQNTAIENETFAVRILGVIDEEELALDNVGMKVTVSVNYSDEAKEDREASKSMTTETVYTSVLAAGDTVSVYEDLYYDYAYGVVIEGLPAAAGDSVTVTVQLTQNGENYGNTYTKTYTQPAA